MRIAVYILTLSNSPFKTQNGMLVFVGKKALQTDICKSGKICYKERKMQALFLSFIQKKLTDFR